MSRGCTNHPSRPATEVCSACGAPLCERCAGRRLGRIYCSLRCALLGTVRRAGNALWVRLPVEIPAPWAILAVAAASAALLTVLVVYSARLLSEAVPPDRGVSPAPAGRTRAPLLHATLSRTGRTWRLEVEGPPGLELLAVSGSRPLAVLSLDRTGHATADGLRLQGTAPSVRLVPLGRTVLEVVPPPRPTSTAAPTATPSPSPTATPTPTPTATPSPTPTPRPTATPTPTPSPTPAAVPWTPVPPPRPAMSGATPAPRPRRRGPGFPDLELVPDAGPRIALTFDGGSDGNGAGQVLDALQQLRVRATLFVTGRFIEEHPGVVRRALLEGHEVGNHTMRHPHLTTYELDRRQALRPEMTRERFRRELLDAEAAFLRATGRPMAPLWRAPYGEENSTLRRWAFELGYLHVRWSLLKGHSLDSRDWVADEHSSLYEDTDRMVERLLRFPHLEGGIVLMHLASKRAHPAWSRIPDLVQRLRARRLEVVPVSELLAASPTWSPRLEQAARRHRATLRTLRR